MTGSEQQADGKYRLATAEAVADLFGHAIDLFIEQGSLTAAN
ncbi:hypothetical protein ACJ0RR_004500 [Serratia liquefaciens]